MIKKFESKGKLLERNEQLKFLANKLHSIEWSNCNCSASQDGFIYERSGDGKEDWMGEQHQRYLDIAKDLLKLTDFNTLVTIINICCGKR